MGSGRTGTWPQPCCWVTLEDHCHAVFPSVRQGQESAIQELAGLLIEASGWDFETAQGIEKPIYSVWFKAGKWLRFPWHFWTLKLGKSSLKGICLEGSSHLNMCLSFSKYKWEQITNEAEMFCLVWFLYWKISDIDLNINCSACYSCGRKTTNVVVKRKHFDYMGWKCFHNFLFKL